MFSLLPALSVVTGQPSALALVIDGSPIAGATFISAAFPTSMRANAYKVTIGVREMKAWM
ncbi:hypothetical protein ABUE29_26325 [Mesorhizobium sp. ZMM04-4]